MTKYRESKERETYTLKLTVPSSTTWTESELKFKCVYDQAKIKLVKIYFEDGSNGFDGRTYVKVHLNQNQIIPTSGKGTGGYGGLWADGEELLIFMDKFMRMDDEIILWYKNDDTVDHDVMVTVELVQIIPKDDIKTLPENNKGDLPKIIVNDDMINVKIITDKKIKLNDDTNDIVKNIIEMGKKALQNNPFLNNAEE